MLTFPDRIIFVLLFCGKHFLSIHEFSAGRKKSWYPSKCAWEEVNLVVLRELYSWSAKQDLIIKIELFPKHKLLRFYYSSYYCCVSTTSETLCGQLCQAPLLPPFPFLSASSLSSPFLLQIFASRICKAGMRVGGGSLLL